MARNKKSHRWQTLLYTSSSMLPRLMISYLNIYCSEYAPERWRHLAALGEFNRVLRILLGCLQKWLDTVEVDTSKVQEGNVSLINDFIKPTWTVVIHWYESRTWKQIGLYFNQHSPEYHLHQDIPRVIYQRNYRDGYKDFWVRRTLDPLGGWTPNLACV